MGLGCGVRNYYTTIIPLFKKTPTTAKTLTLLYSDIFIHSGISLFIYKFSRINFLNSCNTFAFFALVSTLKRHRLCLGIIPNISVHTIVKSVGRSDGSFLWRPRVLGSFVLAQYHKHAHTYHWATLY